MKARSHPPSLLTQVKRTWTEDCGLGKAERIAVAVSGGPDSMALLHCLWLMRESWGLHLCALSVDHGLREESAQEVRMVSAFCEEHEIDFAALSLGLNLRRNVHAQARSARYEALWAAAESKLGPQCFLATAHHRDDRAETVLLRLLRGSSLAGLGVLPPRRERLLRPLIRATRADVMLHLKRHGVPSVNDPSNRDEKYLRTRVRHELLPLLQELGPGVVEHLAALAEEAAERPEALGLSREHRKQLRQATLDPDLPIDLLLPAGLRLVRIAKK